MRLTKTSTLAHSTLGVVDLVRNLLAEAKNRGASDIHIAPGISDVRIRMRVDGVLSDFLRTPLILHGEIVSRIKVLSGLRTDEHQAAQDGRFRFTFPDT